MNAWTGHTTLEVELEEPRVRSTWRSLGGDLLSLRALQLEAKLACLPARGDGYRRQVLPSRPSQQLCETTPPPLATPRRASTSAPHNCTPTAKFEGHRTIRLVIHYLKIFECGTNQANTFTKEIIISNLQVSKEYSPPK